MAKKVYKPTKKRKPLKMAKKGIIKNAIKKLPRVITVDGVNYNTPWSLYALNRRGSKNLSIDYKILVFAIKKRTKSRLSFQSISDLIYKVRDNYAYKQKVPLVGTFEHKLLLALKFDDGYYPRNEVLKKITNIKNQYNIKWFRFHCFDCRRIKTAGYKYVMINSEQETILLFEARDAYLKEIDGGTIIFEVYFAFEKYTNFCLVDFNNIQIDGADRVAFISILRRLIKENDYGTI